MTHERPCIRGCITPEKHAPSCRWDVFATARALDENLQGPLPEPCRGCLPVMARNGALICESDYRRLRRHIEDAPDLLGHIRSIADPTKSGWNWDRVNVASTRPDLPAPVAADLTDASYDVMKTLRDWAVAADASSSYRRGLRAGADSGDAFDIAEACSITILEAYDHLVNRVEVVALADAFLHRHKGEPDWWSVADALARYPLEDRPRYATVPCPSCTTKSVRVLPPRRRGQGFKYLCEACEWEANEDDDGGLWGQIFSDDQIITVTAHDPRWLTVSEAARRVKRTVGTVRGWALAGLLGEGRLGRYWQDTVDDVAAMKRGEAA